MKTKLNPTAVTYKMTIIEDDLSKLEQRRNQIWNEKKEEIALKGFRKGHVPQKHAENVVGFVNLYEEQIHELILEGIQSSDEKVVGVGEAVVELFSDGQPAVIRTDVWLEPNVDIESEQQFKGLQIRPEDTGVEDAEVDAILQGQREQAAITNSVDRPAQEGDVVVINYEGQLEGGGNAGKMENHQVVIGSGAMFANFEQELIGLSAGSTHSIELQFPEDFQAKQLAGKKATYQVEVRDVQERELPDVVDDFAKQLGYESLADARTKIMDHLRTRKEDQSERLVEQQLLNALQIKIPVDPIPECMVENEAVRLCNDILNSTGMTKEQYLQKTSKTEEEFIAEMHNPAMTNVRVRLILEAIARHENIEVTEEQLEEVLQPYYTQFGEKLSKEEIRKRAPVEQLKKNVLIQEAMRVVREAATIATDSAVKEGQEPDVQD